MDRSIDRSDTRTHTPAHTHTHTQVDAYGTQPLTVRQDTVDILVDFAASSEKGLAVVTGQHGMGKSHVMAAVGVTLEVELEGAVVVPLFVGSSAGSCDTRLSVSISICTSVSISISISISI